MSQMLFLLW
jgi:hypothetical protein